MSDELPSETLIRFYGLLDPDAGPEAARAVKRLRRDETRAAVVLRGLMLARGDRPLDDTNLSKAEHRRAFLDGYLGVKRP